MYALRARAVMLSINGHLFLTRSHSPTENHDVRRAQTMSAFCYYYLAYVHTGFKQK